MLGDCDDYARLFCDALSRADCDNYFMVMFDDESGHATCLSDNETVGTFYRVNHGTSNIEKITEFWYPRWLVIRVYKQKPATLGYDLEVVETRRRSYEDIKDIPRNILETKDFGDFIERLAAIDPEIYFEFVEEMMEE